MSATSSSPEQRLAGRLAARRARRWYSPWLLLLLIVALVGAGIIWQLTSSRTGTTTTTTATASRGTLRVTVFGSGAVQPAASRTLLFPVAGTVAEVLVESGDQVAAGQPLAMLAVDELNLALQRADASLKAARAGLAAALGEGATAREIAAAELQLRSAQAQLEKARIGTVTAADLESARAQVDSARARLDLVLAGPTASALSTARARVQKARLSLESQRTSLSVAKTRAESAMITAANSLRNAQDDYSALYWQNRQVELQTGELSQSRIDDEAAALRAVQNAEESYRQARLALEQAQQAEIIGIQQAEAELRDAEEQLRVVEEGPTEAEIAAARASLASAQANLDGLLQGVKPQDLIIAQANVDQARLNLERLTSPGSAASIASAEASVAQALVAYEDARLNLERATLVAPFDGVVSRVTLTPGEAATASAGIVVIDVSSFYVELSLSETDTARVAVGQPVTLTFDALPDLVLDGTVERVTPSATVVQNVVTYLVRVSFNPGTAPVRVGMSATGAILVEQRSDALLVPSRAIRSQNGDPVVQVRRGPGQPPVPVRVQTGLSSGGQTEILRCVDTGDLCLSEGDELVIITTATSPTSRPGGFGGSPFRP